MIEALSLLLSTSFPGGSSNELAAFLAKNGRKDVVVAQSFVRDLSSAELDFASFDLLARSIRAKTVFKVPPGDRLILHDKLLPPVRITFGAVDGPKPTPQWVEWKPEFVIEGKVSLATKGKEALDPIALETARWNRPLKVHWMLGGYALSVNVKAMPEREFLAMVAKAAGGTLREVKGAYLLDLDPEELRDRARNVMQYRIRRLNEISVGNESMQIENAGLITGFVMIQTALAACDKAALVQAFATPKSACSALLGPTSGLRDALLRSAQSFGGERAFDPDTGALRTPAGPLVIDPQGIWKATIRANFSVTLFPPVRSEPGRPTPDLQITFGGS